MEFTLVQQPDGSFVLRFAADCIRTDIALDRTGIVKLNTMLAEMLNRTRAKACAMCGATGGPLKVWQGAEAPEAPSLYICEPECATTRRR
jgi:hypothetical protein